MFNPDARELLDKLQSSHELKQIFTYNESYPYMQMLQDQIDGNVDSWAIRWYASAVINQKLCLYPKKSLIQNIGYGEGTHTNKANTYEATIMADEGTIDFPKIAIEDSKIMRREWEILFRKLNYMPPKISNWVRLKRKMKLVLKKT